MFQTYSTRDEAIHNEVVLPLKPYQDDFDVQQVSEIVIDSMPSGANIRYYCSVDVEEFWRIVEQCAL